MADIFSADQHNDDLPLDVTLNDLVGEGQKYKDPDELAKAYANVEAHARRIEAENAQLRARKDLEDANRDRKNPRDDAQVPSNQVDNPSSTPNSDAPGDKVDLRAQIREEFRALTDNERAERNLNDAVSRLIEIHGDEVAAAKAIQKKANELGVSVDWLRDSAKTSPTAFFATMGVNNSGSFSTPAPSSDRRTDSGTQVKQNFEYFDKLRKENPKLYYSAATQREMMNNARTMGADFYSR